MLFFGKDRAGRADVASGTGAGVRTRPRVGRPGASPSDLFMFALFIKF
jgi:hypothetical protein